jgi:allantoicase
MGSTDSLPDFTWLPDLALRTLGGAVIWANDETFAEKEPGPVYLPAGLVRTQGPAL